MTITELGNEMRRLADRLERARPAADSRKAVGMLLAALKSKRDTTPADPNERRQAGKTLADKAITHGTSPVAEKHSDRPRDPGRGFVRFTFSGADSELATELGDDLRERVSNALHPFCGHLGTASAADIHELRGVAHDVAPEQAAAQPADAETITAADKHIPHGDAVAMLRLGDKTAKAKSKIMENFRSKHEAILKPEKRGNKWWYDRDGWKALVSIIRVNSRRNDLDDIDTPVPHHDKGE